jgi:signal transduction histidine kinase
MSTDFQSKMGCGVPSTHKANSETDAAEPCSLSRTETVLRELTRAFLERPVSTAAKSGSDISERQRLEEAILEISAQEQRRIAQDLHDGLGQHLTGIAFMSKVLEDKLAEKDLAEAAEAAKIVRMVNQAIDYTRQLARGLHPVGAERTGLMSALKKWAGEIEELFHIRCRFACERPVYVYDANVATNLYRIAQEAANNAIRHGQSREIVISLTAKNGTGMLVIEDDGVGFIKDPAKQPGVGLSIMNYRAGMLGGSLKIEAKEGRGLSVTCLFPVRSLE